MSRAKVFISILTVLILIALSGAAVWAAPRGREPSLEPTEEPTAEPTEEPTAEPTEEPTAEPTEEPTAEPTEEPTAEPTEEPTAEPTEEPTVHPVASALAGFITEKLGLEDGLYETIMGYHEEGMGFGVIAKAWWMSFALQENHELLDDILQAKKGEIDFKDIPLPDDIEETPTNWGQFKKAVLKSGKVQKNLANLGAIMSGRAKIATPEPTTEPPPETADAAKQGKDKKGKGPGETGPPGKSKGGEKGGGPPAIPPGQEKDKDKGGGKGKGK